MCASSSSVPVSEPIAIYSGEALVNIVRQLCDSVESRLWIASPYIGGEEAVRCILGRRWWDCLSRDSVRVLTDVDEDNLNIASLNLFRAKGSVKHLRGLHAKLYIIDGQVLVTSANLTRTAFSCRHEIGTVLRGALATHAIAVYEQWWRLAIDISTRQIDRIANRRARNPGEDTSRSLVRLHDLPRDPGEITVQRRFADYEPFRVAYDELARQYAANGRIWPTLPLYFEVDAFLDFLFHHRGRPSHPYTKRSPRMLTDRERHREIARYAQRFHAWAAPRHAERRLKRANTLQRLVAADQITSLTRQDIDEALRALNCMRDARIKKRVLENNSDQEIREAWNNLLYGNGQLTERMSSCAARLFGFKRSGVQELLGWHDPNHYPIRNSNTNAGMRFLGYDVRAD